MIFQEKTLCMENRFTVIRGNLLLIKKTKNTKSIIKHIYYIQRPSY